MDEKKENDWDEFGGERLVMNFSRNTIEPRTIGFHASYQLGTGQTEHRASTYSPAFSASQLALKGGRINNAVSRTTLNVRMECYFSSASYAYFITDECEK